MEGGEGVTYYLLKKTRYAAVNESITVYNQEHGDVWLCKTDKGTTFPCHKRHLGESPVELVIESPKERKQPERRKPYTQAEKLQIEYLNSIP